MNKKMIIDAYCRIRKIDNTIPDDVLDFMKDASLEKLEHILSEQAKCVHPYSKVMQDENGLKCSLCEKKLTD